MFYNGSSMAAPQAAGLVAMMHSKPSPDCVPAVCEAIVKANTKPFGAATATAALERHWHHQRAADAERNAVSTGRQRLRLFKAPVPAGVLHWSRPSYQQVDRRLSRFRNGAACRAAARNSAGGGWGASVQFPLA